MGAGYSVEDVKNVVSSTKFSEEDIKILYRKFRTIDADKSGTLTTDEFLKIPELAANPLLERVIKIFDADGNNEIEFTEFITGLSTFYSGTQEQKLRFIFRVYDVNNDGYISNGELFTVLKMIVGSNLTETQLQQVVDTTMLRADKNRTGKVSFEDFCAMVGDGASVSEKLTISLS
jgi:serine/threonine-protein phosphatase 2B regulatory subunit